jgi:hypothetical protein
LQNAPFCPACLRQASLCACPVECEAYITGVVKIITFVDLDQNDTFFKGLISNTILTVVQFSKACAKKLAIGDYMSKML